MSERALALIGRPVEPGLVPRGFAEEVLTRVLEIDEPEALWEGATTLAGLAQKWNGHGQEKAEIKAAQMFCEIQLQVRRGSVRSGPLWQDVARPATARLGQARSG